MVSLQKTISTTFKDNIYKMDMIYKTLFRKMLCSWGYWMAILSFFHQQFLSLRYYQYILCPKKRKNLPFPQKYLITCVKFISLSTSSKNLLGNLGGYLYIFVLTFISFYLLCFVENHGVCSNFKYEDGMVIVSL